RYGRRFGRRPGGLCRNRGQTGIWQNHQPAQGTACCVIARITAADAIGRTSEEKYMTAPRLCIRDARLYERPVRLRLPFRFGVTTLMHAPQAFVRVRVENEAGANA